MRFTNFIVIPVAAAMLVACGTESNQVPTEQAVGVTVDAPRITVQSTGTAPQFVMQYRATDESTQKLSIGQGFNQSVWQADAVKAMPELGDADTTFSATTSGKVLELEDAMSTQITLQEIEYSDLDQASEVRSTEGFQFGWFAQPSGVMSSTNFSAPDSSTDTGRAITEQHLMSLLGSHVVFPEEAIGVGASWTVDARVTGEATLLQTATYTVTAIDADSVNLDVKLSQRPSLGAVAAEDGTQLQVLSSNTASEGSLRVNLDSPLPVSGQMHYTTRVVYGEESSETRVVQDNTTLIRFD